jgi:hypothetical protein
MSWSKERLCYRLFARAKAEVNIMLPPTHWVAQSLVSFNGLSELARRGYFPGIRMVSSCEVAESAVNRGRFGTA